jgi:hypothetical protein
LKTFWTLIWNIMVKICNLMKSKINMFSVLTKHKFWKIFPLVYWKYLCRYYYTLYYYDHAYINIPFVIIYNAILLYMCLFLFYYHSIVYYILYLQVFRFMLYTHFNKPFIWITLDVKTIWNDMCLYFINMLHLCLHAAVLFLKCWGVFSVINQTSQFWQNFD